MARRGIEPMAEEHVNVTPLIDVVMCLIIFFLVCGKLTKDEREGGAISIPMAVNGQEIKDQRGRLIINLVPESQARAASKKGEAGSAGGNTGKKNSTSERPVIFVRGSERQLGDIWAILSAEVKKDKDLKVVIRADQKLNYEFVAPLLVDCARANIKTINFATVSQ